MDPIDLEEQDIDDEMDEEEEEEEEEDGPKFIDASVPGYTFVPVSFSGEDASSGEEEEIRYGRNSLGLKTSTYILFAFPQASIQFFSSKAAADIIPRIHGLLGVGHGAETPLCHLQVLLPLGRASRVAHRDVSQEQMRLDVSTLLGNILRRGNVQVAPREATQGMGLRRYCTSCSNTHKYIK